MSYTDSQNISGGAFGGMQAIYVPYLIFLGLVVYSIAFGPRIFSGELSVEQELLFDDYSAENHVRITNNDSDNIWIHSILVNNDCVTIASKTIKPGRHIILGHNCGTPLIVNVRTDKGNVDYIFER